jgi:hypothetical protein
LLSFPRTVMQYGTHFGLGHVGMQRKILPIFKP